MTSVGVISSAAASIKWLKDLHQNSGSWPNEADGLLEDLEKMKRRLVDAETETEEELKIKEVVRLSYEIVDAIADSLKPSSSIFDRLTRSGSTKLQDLNEQLKNFLGEKKAGGEKSSYASPPSKKAGNPSKENVRAIERKNSTGPSAMEKFKNIFQPKVKKTNKPDSTTGFKGDNKAAGSESITVSETNLATTDLFDLLKTKLLQEPLQDDSRKVYIAGESGMGKSTLARKLYDDPDVRKDFQVFCWVPINHNFRIKAVLQILLQQLGPWQEEQQLDLTEMNEFELISQIFDVVEDKSYLLVLDGIDSLEDWESIRLALPLVKSTGVIITTSSNDFSSHPHHYRISGLTQSETLALLNKEANFDSKVGEAIYHTSCGIPLYATILGKSLKSEVNTQYLVDELVSYKEGTPQVLGACYKRLAPELKPCFLYLGQFPPCQDIQVDKLYRLLVAENLITPPEESLRDYLKILADLKVVRVEEDLVPETGLYKTCRVHDQVRKFCKSQGLDEEFFQIVDFESPENQVVELYTRRLAVYMTKYRGDTTFVFEGNDTVKKILSLLIFDSGDQERSGWPSEIKDLTDFAHLRVLSFDGVNFKARKPPKGLEKLSLLRFLSFRGCFLEELPSNLSKLTQLETLDLLVQEGCCMIIPGDDDIFTSMKRMVHLYLPRKCKGNGKKKPTLQGLEMLETLINFNAEIFEVGGLSQLNKLKILSTITNGENSEEMKAVINLLNGQREKLQHSSVEINGFDFYNAACKSALKDLLQCRFVHSVQIEGEIWELSGEEDSSICGERVAEMVLRGSELEFNPMGYLGKFQNLRSLVLADDAFVGTDIIIPSSPLFPKLRSLKLQNLQYLEKLTIKEGALPELSSLQIESCGFSLELTIPEKLYHRLKKEIGPSPFKLITTP